MIALGSIATMPQRATLPAKTTACRQHQLRAVRRGALVVRAVSQSEASPTLEQLVAAQQALEKEVQHRDYWRMRCMEAEERLKKLKEKMSNMAAHDHPAPAAAQAAPVPSNELHLGQKRYLLPEDDNKGRRDM